jgi:hypothetical protein
MRSDHPHDLTAAEVKRSFTDHVRKIATSGRRAQEMRHQRANLTTHVSYNMPRQRKAQSSSQLTVHAL